MTPDALDAITLDAYGTLIELDEPVARLRDALRDAGIVRTAADVEQAFAHEVAYYSQRMCDARDEASLAALRRDCARVFVEALGAEAEFTDAFMASIVFRPLPGVLAAVAGLRARGLALAAVSNWDCSLPERLGGVGIELDAVVTCAEAGAAKPAPAVFALALERLGVSAERTLHVGDGPDDAEGARVAGMHFAPAPLAEVVAAWP